MTERKKKVTRIETPVPDSWVVEETSGKLYLTFIKDEVELMKVEINAEIFGPLLSELNEIIITDDNLADSWTLRKPDNSELPDYFSLIKEGKVLATLPVDKATGFKLMMRFNHYKPKVSPWKSLKTWAKKHKFQAGFSFLVLVVPLAYSIGVMLYEFVIALF
jgi:hypothetical protein